MSNEFYTRERCFITELLNDANIPSVSLARCRVAPGVQTELHRLGVDEWYVVESGTGKVRVGAEAERLVGRGDTVAIPAGTPQQISNTGDDQLLFLCVCIPRFTPQSYEPLEE